MPSIKKIKCLVIDDEQPARDILHKHIEGVETLELTGSCNNAVEALSFLQSNTVDLLFLDIQMPHILGTNFMRTLLQQLTENMQLKVLNWMPWTFFLSRSVSIGF
jgi:CheY-like chemotaxis protein